MIRDSKLESRLRKEAKELREADAICILSFLQKVIGSPFGVENLVRLLRVGSDDQLTTFIKKVLEGE